MNTTMLDQLMVLTGCSDDLLLEILMEDAERFCLEYTNRTVLPEALNSTVRRLAVIGYNRLGTEGEKGRSEGGESYTFDSAPKEIFDILDRYRLVRVSGYAYEKKTAQGDVSEAED